MASEAQVPANTGKGHEGTERRRVQGRLSLSLSGPCPTTPWFFLCGPGLLCVCICVCVYDYGVLYVWMYGRRTYICTIQDSPRPISAPGIPRTATVRHTMPPTRRRHRHQHGTWRATADGRPTSGRATVMSGKRVDQPADGRMYGLIDGRTDGQTDRRTNGRTDGRTSGRTGGRTDG